MEKEWIRAISLFNLFTLSSIVRRGYGLPPRITIFLIYPTDRYPSGVLRELVFSNHLQDNSNHFVRKSIIGYDKLYIYVRNNYTRSTTRFTCSRFVPNQITRAPRAPFTPRNVFSKKHWLEKRKEEKELRSSHLLSNIYIHINHHLPPINSTKTAFRFPCSKRKKREVQRGQKNRKGEKEEFRKLGNGEGNRLRWHAVPLREDEGGRGRISGRNLRPRL